MRSPYLAVGFSLSVATAGVAADHKRPLVAPLVPCPPVVVVPACPPAMPGGTMPQPGTPVRPGDPGSFPQPPGTPNPGSPTTPGNPGAGTNAPPTSDAGGGGGFARQSEGGTQVAQSFAPNMFGDILGARGFRVTYQANASARFRLVGAAFLADGSRAVVVSPTAGGRGTITFNNPADNRSTTVDMTALAGGQNLDYVQPVTLPGALDTAFSTQALELLLSRGVITAGQQAQLARLTPDQRAQLLRSRGLLNPAVTQALGGLTTPDVQVGGVTGTIAGGDVLYDFAVRSEAVIALPGAGGTVGRVKLSEDNSPIPRDRFIFTYDHFDSVPYTSRGFTVNRYQFGVEKTFLDGRWSAEFRLPFAATLAATSVQGFEAANTELGNVRFAFKRVVTQNRQLTTSAGVAVTLPTAADQAVYSPFDGSALYRFKNESVTVEPFAAALFTPNDRLFSQLWGSVNFDASGGRLTWNRDVFGGGGAARVWDTPILALDYQIGYWLVRRDAGTFRGLAPFAELHWNRLLGEGEALRQLNTGTEAGGLRVVGVGNNELNLSAGFLARIGDNLNVSIGASVPLLQKPDRTFDAQVGVRASYLFGRTAQARNPISAINSY